VYVIGETGHRCPCCRRTPIHTRAYLVVFGTVASLSAVAFFISSFYV
jgi:hypothetical protein